MTLVKYFVCPQVPVFWWAVWWRNKIGVGRYPDSEPWFLLPAGCLLQPGKKTTCTSTQSGEFYTLWMSYKAEMASLNFFCLYFASACWKWNNELSKESKKICQGRTHWAAKVYKCVQTLAIVFFLQCSFKVHRHSATIWNVSSIFLFANNL